MYISKQKYDEIKDKLTWKVEKALLIMVLMFSIMASFNLLHAYYYAKLIGNFQEFKMQIIITAILFPLLLLFIATEFFISLLYQKKFMKLDTYQYDIYIYVIEKLYRRDIISFNKMKRNADVYKKANQRFLMQEKLKKNNKDIKEKNIEIWKKEDNNGEIYYSRSK